MMPHAKNAVGQRFGHCNPMEISMMMAKHIGQYRCGMMANGDTAANPEAMSSCAP